MAAHRYWRLLISQSGGSNYVGITELKMAEAAGGANVCTGGTPSASSILNASYPASNAFDGVLTSAASWYCAPYTYNSGLNSWIQYDFGGTPRDIAEITISHYGNSGGEILSYPSAFALYYSDDNVKWVRQRSWSNLAFSVGESKVLDATALPSALITNRLINDRKNKSIEAALPQTWYASAVRSNNMCRGRNNTRPWRLTPFSGNKRIAGSTTSLGVPLARRVDLVEQKSGLLVERVNTPETGEFEFKELADGTYSLVGVDSTAEQNSVIFAHVAAVP